MGRDTGRKSHAQKAKRGEDSGNGFSTQMTVCPGLPVRALELVRVGWGWGLEGAEQVPVGVNSRDSGVLLMKVVY